MKIDVSKVENYAAMTAEEKVAFYEAYELPDAPKDSDAEKTRLKEALSRANAEAASWKKQLREKQTEQERAEAERAEREKAVEEELRGLRREKSVSGFVAQYLALGYNKELAIKAAEATADNDAAAILACQHEFIEAKTKEIEAAALNKQPSLSVGAPPTASDVDNEADRKLRQVMGLPLRK